MGTAFDLERLNATKLQIVAYEDAILAVGEGGAQSYTLDTGQDRQVVTKLNLTELQNSLDKLLNRYDIYYGRCYGGGVVIAGPAC